MDTHITIVIIAAALLSICNGIHSIHRTLKSKQSECIYNITNLKTEGYYKMGTGCIVTLEDGRTIPIENYKISE